MTILETSDVSLLLVARSVLESAGIPAFARGEGIQELIGAGRIEFPVELQVPRDRARDAADLLATLPPPETSEA